MKLDRVMAIRLAAAPWLAASAFACLASLRCAPAQRPAPAQASPPVAERQRDAAPAPPVVSPRTSIEITAPPPALPASGAPRPSPAVSSAAPSGVSSTVSSRLACIAPPDPEFDRESPWSKAIGERLERELPGLARCSSELPEEQTASVTLRFIYAGNGAPRSQHIVGGAPAGCAAAECVRRALAGVRAPKLIIEQGAFDLPLILERGRPPRRTQDERAGLSEASDSNDPASCVDPIAARLSRSAVDEIVETTFGELQSCYAHAISRDHAASGTVTFEFVIGLDGEVALVQARDSTLYDCVAIECMLAPFRQLRFPPPLGRTVRVIYPIRYSIEQPPVQLR
jgi:hypothetical protein